MSDIRYDADGTTSAPNTRNSQLAQQFFPAYRGKDVGNVNVTYAVVSFFFLFCVRLHRGIFYSLLRRFEKHVYFIGCQCKHLISFIFRSILFQCHQRIQFRQRN